MSERYGLKSLLERAERALGRLTATISVSDVCTLDVPHPIRIDYSLSTSAYRISHGIRSTTAGSPDYSLTVRSFGRMPALIPKCRHISESIDLTPRRISVVGRREVILRTPPWEAPEPRPTEIDFIDRTWSDVETADFRIDEAKPVGDGCLFVLHPCVDDIDMNTRPIPRRNMDSIFRQPARVSATPWHRMEREFILACWQRLRKAAIERLDRDPGRDLEMQAVFRDIDVSRVRRSRYDQRKRKLLLYFGMSPHPPHDRLGRCAIIIGMVKGTGEIIQVAMPLGGT